MHATLTLAVDGAIVPPDHPLYKRQNAGIYSMKRLAEQHPDSIRVVEQQTPLGTKPRIKDLMQLAATPFDDWPPPGTTHFVGFLNSDNLVTEKFARSMASWEQYDAIRIRRTDLIPLGHNNFEYRPLRTACAEGVIMQLNAWVAHHESYPDGFVIGEPCWDTCWIIWIHDRRLRVARLDNGEVLHHAHPATWKQHMKKMKNYAIFKNWMWKTGRKHFPKWKKLLDRETVL